MSDTVVASTANASMVDAPFVMQAVDGDTPIAYTAMDFRHLLDALIKTEGVLGLTDFKMVQRAAGANFSVDVSAGYAAIQGDSIAEQGKYLTRASGVVNLVTPGAPGSGTRNHRGIIRIRDKQSGGGATTYDWTLEVLEDTGSGTPAVPASALNLGTIAITAGQANVATANITDGRVTTSIGGSYETAKYYFATNGPIAPDTWTESQHLLMSVTYPDPGWPYYIEVMGQAETGAAAGTRYDLWATYTTAGGTQIGSATVGADGDEPFVRHICYETTAQTGGKTIVFAALKAYGSGQGSITQYQWNMTVKLVRAG